MKITMAEYSRENSCFFERRIYNRPMTMANMHFHDTHELYYLVKGRTKYFIGNEIFLLESGDMVFIPKFVYHKTDNGDNTYVERLRLVFDDTIAGDEEKKYINQLKDRRLLKIPTENQTLFQNIFQQIENEENKKQSGYTEMEQLYFRQLLILISRYCTEENSSLGESFSIVQCIAKDISENYNTDLSLEVLSKKYGISTCHLSRLFKNITGVGLNEYINISRISAAEKLLSNTNHSITQIATQCGFNDSSYFSSVFKKLKGITPKKYALAMNKNTKENTPRSHFQ